MKLLYMLAVLLIALPTHAATLTGKIAADTSFVVSAVNADSGFVTPIAAGDDPTKVYEFAVDTAPLSSNFWLQVDVTHRNQDTLTAAISPFQFGGFLGEFTLTGGGVNEYFHDFQGVNDRRALTGDCMTSPRFPCFSVKGLSPQTFGSNDSTNPRGVFLGISDQALWIWPASNPQRASFRILVVPEPSVATMMMVVLLGLLLGSRKVRGFFGRSSTEATNTGR